MVLRAQSTTKDYIRAEHKLHSISKSFISQVITVVVVVVIVVVVVLVSGDGVNSAVEVADFCVFIASMN